MIQFPLTKFFILKSINRGRQDYSYYKYYTIKGISLKYTLLLLIYVKYLDTVVHYNFLYVIIMKVSKFVKCQGLQ